jgi:D-sedoheptulose 7-phosphate isomerase
MRDEFSAKEYFFEIVKSSIFFSENKELDAAIEALSDIWKKTGTVFTMGCGGSASTATHFAADLAKTTIVKGQKRFKSISLVDNIPLVSAWTNDSGWGTVFTEQLEPWIGPNDCLIGFSVHGGKGDGEAGPWSQNLVSAMKFAKTRGATVIGFSGFDGGAFKQLADISLVVPISSDIYGTPAIEAFHVVLHHAIIFKLKQMIKNMNNNKKDKHE